MPYFPLDVNRKYRAAALLRSSPGGKVHTTENPPRRPEGALRRGWHRFRNLQLPWDAEERFPAAQGNVAVLDQGLIAQALAGRWPETVHLPGQPVLPSSMFGVSLVPRETYVYPVGRRLRDEKEGQTGRPTQPGAL